MKEPFLDTLWKIIPGSEVCYGKKKSRDYFSASPNLIILHSDDKDTVPVSVSWLACHVWRLEVSQVVVYSRGDCDSEHGEFLLLESLESLEDFQNARGHEEIFEEILTLMVKRVEKAQRMAMKPASVKRLYCWRGKEQQDSCLLMFFLRFSN